MKRIVAAVIGVIALLVISPYLFGTALATMTLWFPVTYGGYRGSMKVANLKNPYFAYFSSVVLYMIYMVFFGEPKPATQTGMALFVGIPILTSFVILKAFYVFERTPETIKAVETKSVVNEAVVPPSPPPHVAPTKTENTRFEIIGFRLMLLAWGSSAAILLVSGYSYYAYQSKRNELMAVAQSYGNCQSKAMSEFPACNSIERGAEEACIRQTRIKCGGDYYDKRVDWMAEDRNTWQERHENSMYLAGIIFATSVISYYGLRWAFTGKLRPLRVLR